MKSSLDFSRFRVITFDCYGTLVDWETGILNALRPILSAHGAILESVEILRLYGDLEALAEASEYRPYREVLKDATWKPFPDTVASLRKLKTKFKLGIISNVDDDLFSATASQLEIGFDYVTTAGQARAYKPSLEIFRLAQKKMNTPSEQWLHAAQSIYHDVIPAKSLGISTVWVNRPSQRPGAGAAQKASAAPDVEVSSLAELAQLAI